MVVDSTTRHSTGAYRQYMLVVLTGLLLSNYVDRMPLGILLQDIKIELNLSDTELGFLGGISFATRTWTGEESLRYSLLCVVLGYFTAARAIWLARNTVTHDIAAAASQRSTFGEPRVRADGSRGVQWS